MGDFSLAISTSTSYISLYLHSKMSCNNKQMLFMGLFLLGFSAAFMCVYALATGQFGITMGKQAAFAAVTILPLSLFACWSLSKAYKCRDKETGGDSASHYSQDGQVKEFKHRDGPDCGPIPGSTMHSAGVSTPQHVYVPPVPAKQFGSPEKTIQPDDSLSAGFVLLLLGVILLPCVGGGAFLFFSRKNN